MEGNGMRFAYDSQQSLLQSVSSFNQTSKGTKAKKCALWFFKHAIKPWFAFIPIATT
eukprot:Pgem_evm1s16302